MNIESSPNNNSFHDDTYEKMVMKQIREKQLARAAMASQAEDDYDDGPKLKDLINDGLGDASADDNKEAGLKLKDITSTLSTEKFNPEKGEPEEYEADARLEKASRRVADKIADFEDTPSFKPIRKPTRKHETTKVTEATPTPEPNSEKPAENETASLPPEFYIVSGDIYHNYEKNFKKNSKLLERSLASGVQRSIERGYFNVNENSLLRQGFWAEEENKIQTKLDTVNDYTDVAFEAIKELKSRIGGLLDQESDKVTTAEISEAKYEGSLEAIRTGARSNGHSSNEVIFSVPPNQGEKVKEFMEEAGIDFENDDNIRTESYQGFINVIEEIKDKHDLTDDGFRVLDWYFDNFNYAKNYDDFRDTLDSYTGQADLDFEDKWLEYLDYRDEIKSLQLAKLSRDQDTYDKIADFVEVASGQDFNDMEEEELFPMPDYNKPKQKSGNSKPASWPSSSEKIAAAYPKLEAITKLDPDATFYRGSIFKRDEHPYLVVRFGANNMNNVIVIPYGDDSDAMFAWHGETGDDRDGWKAYFKNTSIRTRNTEVERYQCNGYSKDPVDAINREWDRIEKHLSIELPDYTPASSPSGSSIENQLYEAAEDISTSSSEKDA